jgi:hypothetical protein
MQVDWGCGWCSSGVLALLFSPIRRLEAGFAPHPCSTTIGEMGRGMEIVLDLAATAAPGPSGHRKGVARQGRKAPQEEDLASIDTVLRMYGRLLCVGATLRLLSHGKPVDPHNGAHRLDPSSGICCPRPPAKPLRRLAERVSLRGRMPCAERIEYRQASRLHLPVDGTTTSKGWIPYDLGGAFLC